MEIIKVTVMIKPKNGMTTNYTREVQTGILVFEIFANMPGMPRVEHENIQDSEGNFWRADDRVWRAVTFTDYLIFGLLQFRWCGHAQDSFKGIGDAALNSLGEE